MKRIVFLLFIGICNMSLFAQDEILNILKYNTSLFYKTYNYQNLSKIDIVDNSVVVFPSSLPFIDDFSTNSLSPYNTSTVDIFDTIEIATGSCVTGGNFILDTLGFHTSTSYSYSYNTATDQVDSIALSPVDVYDFSNTDCFPVQTGITSYWEPYYRSDSSDFDAVTGEKLDSTLVSPDILLAVSTIYFANMPDAVHWTDNYAWQNYTNAIEPLSIGVATLDGLNEFGLPYNNSVTNAYGIADYLTSKSIDLSTLSMDSNVYLSFFYQSGGMGDEPNVEDSLVVEFLGVNNQWERKWSTAGIPRSDFRQVYIPIFETAFDSLIYANNNFKFRFKNYASLSGNNDLWNIEYVRLDKDRLPNTIDSVIRDVSILQNFPNYLKTYSMLPWDQMQAGSDSFSDSLIFSIRDNGQVEGLQTGAFPLDIDVSNSINSDIIYNESGSNFNPVLGQEIKDHIVLPFTNFVLPSISNTDSVIFYNEFIIQPTSRNVLLDNDTLRNQILFNNVIAYDDGSAERAYGLSGGGTELKSFAYSYKIAKEDTLAAIQIHFSNVDVNVETLVFSLYVWDSIGIGNDYSNVIGSIENKTPEYINYKNGFATFVFDTPVIVSNKFYIGWSQSENRNVQIGYDLNSTKGRENMFIFTDNSWKSSGINLDGSPMIRAILDGNYPLNPTPILEVDRLKNTIVFPNPTNEKINIKIPDGLTNFETIIYDYTGKVLTINKNESQIDVGQFESGLYIITIIDKDSKNKRALKFIKE